MSFGRTILCHKRIVFGTAVRFFFASVAVGQSGLIGVGLGLAPGGNADAHYSGGLEKSAVRTASTSSDPVQGDHTTTGKRGGPESDREGCRNVGTQAEVDGQEFFFVDTAL